MLVCAFGFGVGGLGLVDRSLRWRVWGSWVEDGQWWVVLLGLGLVGWGWSIGVCAGGFGVRGLRTVSGGLCFWVWGWWVGVGWSWFVLAGMEWVGLGLVGRAAPLSYGEERNAFGKDTARGPLAGFKRLRATAGQGPNYVGPSCGFMLAYVGLMLTHVEPKDAKNGNSKKTL